MYLIYSNLIYLTYITFLLCKRLSVLSNQSNLSWSILFNIYQVYPLNSIFLIYLSFYLSLLVGRSFALLVRLSVCLSFGLLLSAWSVRYDVDNDIIFQHVVRRYEKRQTKTCWEHLVQFPQSLQSPYWQSTWRLQVLGRVQWRISHVYKALSPQLWVLHGTVSSVLPWQ